MASRTSAERIPLIALSPPVSVTVPRAWPSIVRQVLGRLEDVGIGVLVVLAFPVVMLMLGGAIALVIKAVTGAASLFG